MKMEYDRCRMLIEDSLGVFFTGKYPYGILLESMRYSLLGESKRIRPVLCLKFCEAAGGDMNKTLDAACAIEMLHTYSLIHDDLPCMDDDEIRRSAPSNHIKYGEFTATLAGDALQAAAFDTLLNSKLAPDAVVEMARILAKAAGAHGICGGQFLDMGDTRPSIAEIEEIHRLKTSALISAATRIGVVAAGGTQEQVIAAEEYALALGLAFQVRDDLLDHISTTEQLGKPTGSDKKSEKMTFAALMSEDECRDVILRETKKAAEALDNNFSDPSFLVWMAQMLAERKY